MYFHITITIYVYIYIYIYTIIMLTFKKNVIIKIIVWISEKKCKLQLLHLIRYS